MKLHRVIRYFFYLSFSKKVLLLNCFLFLFLTTIFYSFLSFDRIVRITSYLSKILLRKKVSKFKVEEINNFHLKVANFFFDLSCLPLCISAKLVLSTYGYEVKIQSGIKVDVEKVKGHAWLVLNNEQLLDKNEIIHEYQKSILIK